MKCNWFYRLITIIITTIVFNLIISGTDDLLRKVLLSTLIAVIITFILKKVSKHDLF